MESIADNSSSSGKGRYPCKCENCGLFSDNLYCSCVCCAVVKDEESQKASAHRTTKKDPTAVPVPHQKSLVINEASQTRVSAEKPVTSGVNVGVSKGKEVLMEERPLKRMKTIHQKSGTDEISRVEFDGDEILKLYSGDTLILPPTDFSAEDVQEELRGFIPQALKLANVLTVQLNKMASRIRELEAENARAKEVEKVLVMALQEKTAAAEHAARAGLRATGSAETTRRSQDLETQFYGQPVVESLPDARLDLLIRDVEVAATMFGSNSEECAAKQAQLDKMLRAQAAFAEQKARDAKLKREKP